MLATTLGACGDAPTTVPATTDLAVPTPSPSFAVVGGGGPTGAIFTTVPDGSIVNENVRYRDKREVYLDGGPRGGSPQTAAGLDDGWYVFQITDPSGKYLLSMDPAMCRVIEVAGGIIRRVVPANQLGISGVTTDSYKVGNTTYPCHVDDNAPHPTNPGVAGASGRHDTNVDVDYGANGAIVVQMMPYGTTPNPGGVYKAWVSTFDAYKAKGGSLTAPPSAVRGRDAQPCPDFCATADPGFGPPRNLQKTDNFKVQEEARLRVVKVNDLNGNGVRDGNEPTLDGWNVAFIEKLGDGSEAPPIYDVTTATRTFVPGDQVTVCEAARADWAFSFATGGTAVSTPGVLTGTWHCVLATVGSAGSTVEIAFGNFQYGQKNGSKFHDRNVDATWNKSTEEGLGGWTINLTGTDGKGNAVSRSTTTNGSGYYEFKQLAPGSYTVAEACPAGWYQSYPAASHGCGSGVHAFAIVSGAPGAPDVHADNDFGNYQPSTKSGVKYHDLNGNGSRDAGEPGIAGVTIALLLQGNVEQTTVTDAQGSYQLTGLLPTKTYLVCEVLPPGHAQSAPNGGTSLGAGESLADCPTGYAARGYQVSVTGSGQSFTGNDFGNYQNAEISGYKIGDVNGDGVKDAGEGGLQGWTIHLFGTTGLGASEHRHATTDLTGKFEFKNVPPGLYSLCEEQKSGYIQRFPTLATEGTVDCATLVHVPALTGVGYEVTLRSADLKSAGFDFLNQANQGCTPGFWQGGYGIDLWNTANDPQWGLPRIINGSTNPFTQSTIFNAFFKPAWELAGMTMLDIVGTGGTDVNARKAARSLIAAYLNRSSGLAYPYELSQLISEWEFANITAPTGQTTALREARLLDLHTRLDAANNLHNAPLCQ
jgi:hypothetical protein